MAVEENEVQDLDISTLTVDDMTIPGQEQAPPVVETPAVTTNEVPPEAPPTNGVGEKKPEAPPQPEPFDWKAKTGGKYENFDRMWQDLQTLQSQQQAPPEKYEWKDDFIKQAVEYYEQTGDLTPYLEAKSVNYDELSDEAIIKRNLRSQYPDLDDNTFGKLYQREIRTKYGFDEDADEEDQGLAAALMKSDAQKLRQTYKEQQAKFAPPEKKDTKPQADPEVDPETKAKLDAMIKADPFVQRLNKDGKFDIKYGDETFTMEASDVADIQGALNDTQRIFAHFIDVNDKGEVQGVKFDNYVKTYEYAKDPAAFEKRLIDYGRSLGANEFVEDLTNPTRVQTPNRDQPTATGSGDWRDEFGAAIKAQFPRPGD